MQSGCLNEAGISASGTLEETTLLGLTFGGYLRSKVIRGLLGMIGLRNFFFVKDQKPILSWEIDSIIPDRVHEMWKQIWTAGKNYGSYCWDRRRHRNLGRSFATVHSYRDIRWRKQVPLQQVSWQILALTQLFSREWKRMFLLHHLLSTRLIIIWLRLSWKIWE